MNEILTRSDTRRRPRKEAIKSLMWKAFNSCALGGLYAWQFGDHWLRIEQHRMPLRGLAPAWDGATIAQISDLHCSPFVLETYLHQCVEQINALGVDFVALTGDFITGPKHYARRVGRVLSHLQPRVASLACLGNHDYGLLHRNGLGYVRGLDFCLTESLSRADIFVMRNERHIFRRDGEPIQFVGVEDLWTQRYNPALAFELANPTMPTVTLLHNPRGAHDCASFGPQYILSGHTHGREPDNTPVTTRMINMDFERYHAGYYPLGPDRHLYVNRGLSYGQRRNTNSRPEVTIFTLEAAE